MTTKHPELVRAHITRALDEIQAAQNRVSRAVQELSTICGAVSEYDKGHKVHDQIHSYWYKVNALLSKPKLKLDHEPNAQEYVRYGLEVVVKENV